jgi:hypothetical protein
VQLIDDVELLDRFGELGIFEALSRGDAHMYPEVTCPDPKSNWSVRGGWSKSGLQVWRSQEGDAFDRFVIDAKTVCPTAHTHSHARTRTLHPQTHPQTHPSTPHSNTHARSIAHTTLASAAATRMGTR